MRSLTFSALFLLSAGAQAQQPPPQIRTVPVYSYPGDEIACKLLSQASASMMKELPKALDSLTTLDGWVVICALKSSAINKSVAANLGEFPTNWPSTLQAQLDRDTCDKPHLREMVQHGWRFFQNISFENGERLSLQADCDRNL